MAHSSSISVSPSSLPYGGGSVTVSWSAFGINYQGIGLYGPGRPGDGRPDSNSGSFTTTITVTSSWRITAYAGSGHPQLAEDRTTCTVAAAPPPPTPSTIGRLYLNDNRVQRVYIGSPRKKVYIGNKRVL